jgi:hypothetical protein
VTDNGLPIILISKRSWFLKYLICIDAIAADYLVIVGTIRVRYHDFMDWEIERTADIRHSSESGHSQA